MRLRFAFRDAEGQRGARARLLGLRGTWIGRELAADSARVVQDGFAAVALDPSSWRGRAQGEAEIVLTPLQPGQYRYSVQVEDAAGHRSNVLEASFTVRGATGRRAGLVLRAGAVTRMNRS